jgi:hypothetical protein
MGHHSEHGGVPLEVQAPKLTDMRRGRGDPGAQEGELQKMNEQREKNGFVQAVIPVCGRRHAAQHLSGRGGLIWRRGFSLRK